MLKLSIFCVGKQSQNLLELEQSYLKRLKTFQVRIFETKALDDNKEKEAQNLIELIKREKPQKVFRLEEKGQLFSSRDFSTVLNKNLESSQTMGFLIGGAAGLSPLLEQYTSRGLSLSSLTFPHKFARLLLVEQIYRAETIIHGHPYHK